MAHHGHLRHSRRNRIINAKPELETNDANNGDLNGGNAKLLETVDPIENPIFISSDILSEGACDPLQNVTCPDNDLDTTEDTLSKRQAAESPQTTLVETVVQVIGPNSQTLWVSTAQEFPMTISNPSSGAVPAPELTTAETIAVSVPAISSPTLPTNSIPTQSIISPTQTLVSSKQTQTAAISFPKVLVGSSSTPYTSTPLVTSTSSALSQTSTSSAFNAAFTSTSSNSSTTSSTDSSHSTFTSTSGDLGEPGTGTGTDTGSGAAPSTSRPPPTSGSGSPAEAATPKIVGGVIGSVAGLAMIFLLLYYLLRRRKYLQSMGVQALPSDDAGAREVAERSASNDSLFAATYLAPAFMKRWRNSTMTAKTEDTMSSNPSERGFQKISGRKIPPVLTHGGDGYGGGLDGDSPTIPGYPPISPGGGPLSSQASYGPPPTSPYGMPLDTNYPRETDELTPTRPKAAHFPISSSVTFGSPRTVTPSRPVVQPQSAIPFGSSPDGLGRSLPGYDGNRGSRFTEGLDL